MENTKVSGDRPRSSGVLPAADLARTVVFAALIAVLGLFPGFYVGGGSVPIVLQNAGPLLAGSLLGARRATASVALFLALTAIGLPLLSGGRGGPAPFLGPSGGFLFGFLLSAFVSGLLVTRLKRTGLPTLLLANAAGLLSCYLLGVPFLAAYLGNFHAALVQTLVFVPGDAAKVVVVSLLASVLHRALPGRLPAGAKRAG
ncbi:biotin transporter BioY [Amycolatopsis rhizosphaerae]|uniref:Biotin transporter n=1 Tax=Amycolatopsis rhizosphaerae TaxID=2053003 RepID=A0A557ZY31_9PSEU|nr:biotin transporter BioY [Amycolatopsis rhizosphaerae]TVT16912.1 biotin transporter BioY [Amycolatopsis rhizosphaerae]